MNERRNGVLAPVSTAIFLVFVGARAVAGGLVDTSPERFMASDFTTYPSDDITNAWWTLPAGANFLYFSEEGDECAWNLVEVLEMSTDNFFDVYEGTDARIVLDREWVVDDCGMEWEDVLAAATDGDDPLLPDEITYDWYAQDADANIWYMGEDTRDSEGSSEGSFVAGCDGAEAGIVMLGDPAKGDFYRQEFYEDEAEDWGKVLNFVEMEGDVCLKTKEWTSIERGNIEHKFYCSDGDSGELSMIEELKGKTVVAYLIDRDVAAPPMPAAPPSPIPACEL